MHKITTWAVGALTGVMFLLAPISAGAVTLQDLQNQLATLLQQITQLQSQNSASTSAGSAISSPAMVHYRVCDILNRNLSVGSQGDDVSSLQEFLQGQGYLSVQPTGYFGSLTSQAVAKWQASQGVSAVGSFGPLSRGHLKIWCGSSDGSTGNGVLQATPLSGQSPLTVTFTTSIGINDSVPSVDFGDGQTSAMTKGSCVGITAIVGGQGGIRCSAAVTHTYTQNGAYTATLVNGPQKGDVGISVGGSPQGSVSASPSSGAAPLPVTFTYLPTSENGTYHIDYGDGSSDQMGSQQIQCIKAPCINPAVASHTYTTPGTYTAVVSPYIACLYSNPRCMIAVMMLAKATVTVTGSGSTATAPVISSFSGPTTLSLGATGTWTIQASDPANGTLSYSIDWGDTNAYAPMAMSAGATFAQTTTFTHSYSSAGTYTVTLTVRNSSGQSAQTTSTVQVGSPLVCTMEYAPVCGQLPAPKCAAGMMCPMYMPAPKTYGNMCELNAAGATLLYQGACTNGL